MLKSVIKMMNNVENLEGCNFKDVGIEKASTLH